MMEGLDVLNCCRLHVWHSLILDRAYLSLCEVISGDHAQIPSIMLYGGYALHSQKYQYIERFWTCRVLPPKPA